MRDAAFPEPRHDDQERADENVDGVDPAREAAPWDGRPDEQERRRLRREDGREDRRRVAGAGIPPDPPIEAEEDEEDVSRHEQRRQREIEDVALPGEAWPFE